MATKPKPAKQAAPKQPRKELDWTAIMVHVRAGLRTYDEIGAEFGVSKGRISQKAKELNVTRDLAPAIRARAEAKVNEAVAKDAADKPRAKRLEGQEVEAGAVLMANTILAERATVKRLLNLASGLTTELEAQAEKVALAGRKPGQGAADVGNKPEAAAVRIENLRKLTDTTKTLIALERTVLNIAPDTPIDPTARVNEAIDNGFAGLRAAFNKRLGRA